MSFSRAQQPAFRQISAQAWKCHCARNSFAASDKEAGRAWYEDQLEAATGQRSTTTCNVKDDYENAMAAFERVIGDSIYWQMRAFTGNERRLMYNIHQTAPEFDCTGEYLLGIARQALGRAELPQWHEIRDDERLIILRAVKQQLARQSRRGDKTDHPRRLEEDPF